MMFINARNAECRDGMVAVETALIEREHTKRVQAEKQCRAESAQANPQSQASQQRPNRAVPTLDSYRSEPQHDSANTGIATPAVAGLTG